MIAVVQRVKKAAVSVEGQTVGSCRAGLMIFLGVAAGDDEKDAALLSEKLLKLRIFCDENGKMNRSVTDVVGEILVVSNFTLLANTAHGNRPDFFGAESPARAEMLYENFCEKMALASLPVGRGIFGADMQVDVANDGPVTLILDSHTMRK